MQPTDIEIVEQPTDHVLRDLMRARVVELVAGREYEPIIEPVNSCRHAGTDKRRGLNHRGTGEAAVRMTIFQPKERHIPNLAPVISGREGGKLSPRRAAIEQFRQPCEIERHLPCLVHRQKAGVSCCVRVGSTVEHTELLPSGILDGESVRDLDDPPGGWKAGGHVLSFFADRRG